MGDIKASILCCTYNHAAYIRQALDGFLMQRTTFPVEIIIHDDCSTDGTRAIILEYMQRHPGRIRAVLEEENLFGTGGLHAIYTGMLPMLRGEYTALCEGDDYWTDPLKLQKQVDYLDTHPLHSLCFHRVDELLPDGITESRIFRHLRQGTYTLHDIYSRWSVPTCSGVLRTSILTELMQPDPRITYYDSLIFLTCGKHGQMHCMGESMGVYRRTPEGWVLKAGTSTPMLRKIIGNHEAFGEQFPELGRLNRRKQCDSHARLALRLIRTHDKDWHRALRRGIRAFGLWMPARMAIITLQYFNPFRKRIV